MICTMWKMSYSLKGSNKITYLKVQELIWEKFNDSTSGCGKQWYPHALYIFELCISVIDDSIHMMCDSMKSVFELWKCSTVYRFINVIF
jgi:hypothetical protein